jgi:hypothetical protein
VKDKLVKDKKIHEARAFNFTYRYIDDVLSINNSRFAEFLPLIKQSNSQINECGCKMVNALLINSRMLSFMFVAVKAFMICYLKAQRSVTCL